MSSRRALAGLVLLFALTWTACSSSSQSASSTTTTAAPSASSAGKLSYVKQVCQKSNADLGAAADKAFGHLQPTTAEWQPFMVSTVLPLIEQRLQAIRADPDPLDPAILHAIDVGNAAIASARNNPQQLAPGTRAPFDEYDSLVTAAGVPECGVGG